MAKKTWGASKNWQDKVANRNYVVGQRSRLTKKNDIEVAEERRRAEERVKQFREVGSVETTETLPISWFITKINQVLITLPKKHKCYDFMVSVRSQALKNGSLSAKQKEVILNWKINY